MWPKLLDISQDECRGVLRRLELESYSNVVGVFRAQGILSDVKAKILKDLREAFHISEDRHKAEVRRVVNDESLSTIAKVIYGPNSEIEWNKEGNRGFFIINRSTPQTALSVIADDAADFGDKLNRNLMKPSNTTRDRVLCKSDENLVKSPKKSLSPDPFQMKLKIKRRKSTVTSKLDAAAGAKKRDSNKTTTQVDHHLQSTRNQNTINTNNKTNNHLVSQQITPTIHSKQVTANNRRRKSGVTSLSNSATKTAAAGAATVTAGRIELNNSRRNLSNEIDTNFVNEGSLTMHQNKINDGTVVETEIAETVRNSPVHQFPIQRILSNNKSLQFESSPVISTNLTSVENKNTNVSTSNEIGTIPQGTIGKTVKLVDPNSVVMRASPKTIIKKPITTFSNIYIGKPTQITPTLQVNAKQMFTTIGSTKANIEHLSFAEHNKLAIALKTRKYQVRASEPSSSLSIPSATSCNMAAIQSVNKHTFGLPSTITRDTQSTADSIMHISTVHPNKSTTISSIKRPQYKHISADKKSTYVVHVPNTITMHPNQCDDTTILDTASSTIDMAMSDGADYIIEESTDYEIVEENDFDSSRSVDCTITTQSNESTANVTTYVQRNFQPYIAESAVSPQQVIESQIIYDDQVDMTGDWEYAEGIHSRDGAINEIVTCIDSSNSGHDEYSHGSNVIYTEVIDDDNLTEEYVTTEVFSPSEDVIEMEIDSVNYVNDDLVMTANAH